MIPAQLANGYNERGELEGNSHMRSEMMLEYEAAEVAEVARESEAANEIKEMLRAMLSERYEDEIEFGPIVVVPRYDHEGDACLHSYIVFNGDQKKLDPLWTLRLSRRLWPRAEVLGYPALPVQSFVSRKEWPTMEKWLRKYGYIES